MPDLRAVTAADVYKKDALAGQLTRAGGQVVFRYRPEYLAEPGPAVATTLPLVDGAFPAAAGAVPPFFAGLLPEGARLTALVRHLKTSADDELSLLLAVGADTIGDVRVVPAGTTPVPPPALVRVDRWEDQDFDELFRLSTAAAAGDRLERSALPGVQVKVSAEMVSFPVGSERYLLKLEPEDYPHLASNEAFFLGLARSAGIAVPAHELVRDRNGKRGLLVHRFDRLTRDGALYRRAQEDACQLAGRYPADKYRFTAREVAAALLSFSSVPRVDALRTLAVMAFSYLIGNGDLHAKNLSLGEADDGGLQLTPMYDLLSSLPYLPRDRLALAIEGKNDNLRRTQMYAFARAVRVPERAASRELDRLCTTVASAIPRLSEIGMDERATAKLARALERRVAHLQT